MSAHLRRRMTTIRCSSESSSATVVVLEHATESFSALDFTSDGTNILIRLDEFIAEALMVSLAMIMLDVFTNGVLK